MYNTWQGGWHICFKIIIEVPTVLQTILPSNGIIKFHIIIISLICHSKYIPSFIINLYELLRIYCFMKFIYDSSIFNNYNFFNIRKEQKCFLLYQGKLFFYRG